MPFIRVTDTQTKAIVDLNINKIIKFEVRPGSKFTTIDLDDNWCIHVDDEPRQLRGYIKKAEGTLPEKAEPNVSQE